MKALATRRFFMSSAAAIPLLRGVGVWAVGLGSMVPGSVASQQAGNNRILRMWFAPSLGFVPVQAERTRDGKLEFAMRIKTLKR